MRQYIEWWHGNWAKKRCKIAQEVYAPIIVEECERYNFDPLLVSELISQESSWMHGALGDLDEFGLMQIMPGTPCDHGDVTTPFGQIKAGVRCLNICREKCGDDLEKILTKYASGNCVSKSDRTKRKIKYRIRQYKKAVERFRVKVGKNIPE